MNVVKEGYTIEEVAERLNRAEYTVRQWCNKGQANARKVHGKGRTGEWRVSPDELARLQAEGPQPEGTYKCRQRDLAIRRVA
jgi:transposase